MRRRRLLLPNTQRPVQQVGMGCMFYGAVTASDVEGTVTAALDAGIQHFDTANVYEGGRSEEFVGAALRRTTEPFLLATKCGIRGRDEEGRLRIDGRPDYIRKACEASLERLGLERIDLYYLHRFDPEVPIEDSVGAMAELLREGKIGAIGLSEVGAKTLRRAHAVHPITALQSEYSLWTRGVESDILPTCRELGIALVAYSPLGRGYLSGTVRRAADRSVLHEMLGGRFAAEALERNASWRDSLAALAEQHGLSLASLSLGWLLAQGPDVHPIPGSRREANVRANAACEPLSPELAVEVARIVSDAEVAGDRYPEAMEAQLRR